MSISSVSEVKLSAEVVTLQDDIGKMYDVASGFWEDILGEHIHQGYYDPDAPTDNVREAQNRMIDECLKFAGLSADPTKFPKNVVDVGCGIGGSSRYLAKKYGSKCVGITLSPYQVQRATDLAAAQGLSDNVSFQVANALNMPFPDDHFDLVWSIDVGEHMPEREKFVSELVRVAKPGAPIIIAAWCCRDLAPSEKSLRPWEKEHLDKIKKVYYLAEWCSVSDWAKLVKPHNVYDIKSDNWARYVLPFWPQAIRSAVFSWNGFKLMILSCGMTLFLGVRGMKWMDEGLKKDVVTFGIVTCRKAK
ncbi:gamma-tocopherol methyltransferase, chloroplastic-like [Rutidosis leptorrhynchoides]|uniref:gamma-tocopherol methyltransferase, chloroplastic-like n=1 Tax=Rutidosis leptorrhynchoides TaxID=125765 RepID=UPI003A997ACF